MPNQPPITGDFGDQHQRHGHSSKGPYTETSESYSDDEDDSDSSALDDYGEDGSSESSFTDYEPSKRQMTYYNQQQQYQSREYPPHGA